MTVRASPVPARRALPALADAVAAAKDEHPLAPVTIIVPTNAVGVTARRWLGRHGGVAAIEVLTAARLAERLAGAELAAAGRRPVSTPLLDLTVGAVLDAAPGVFADVADHPSTVTALRDLYRELRFAGPGAVERLAAASSRGREAARIASMVAERLSADWYDEADLFARAVERIRDGCDLFGRAVAFLPRPDPGWQAELLSAIGERTELHLLLEHAGIADVDAEVSAFAAHVGGAGAELGAEPAVDPGVTGDLTVVSTTDADEEVRDAVRRLVAAARDGVPFARMAIVWPVDRPYARLVEHHLDQAAIPWNGRPGTLVTERLVPRFLLDLLHLDRRGLRRGDLFDLLADVPVRDHRGERVSVARWERLARAAGITRDEHWAPRLARLAAALRAADPPREREAAAADELAEFVDRLRRDLGPPSRTRRWSQWADWCEQQVLRRLGRSTLDQLDEAERLASDHASRVLDRLRHLDAVGPPVTRSAFRAAFAAEFEVAPGRLGRLGTGVTIGSLVGTAGLDTDLTVVLGAADGVLPPIPIGDPLIGDAERVAAGLPTSDARARRLRRSFVAHLSTAASAVVTVPRGDLRATTERLPSRWLTAHAADAPEHVVPSHHAGLLTVGFPSLDAEHRLRARAGAARVGPDAFVATVAGDLVAERGLALRAGRRADRLTEFDGDLSGAGVVRSERPMSASQVELWPSCPHAYFVRYLLGVRPLDDGVDDLRLSPIERGNVVHATLDRFHRRVVAGELPQPDDGWLDVHVRALVDLFDEVADEYERTGRTGRAAHWFLDRRRVRDDLLQWFVRDGETAAARHAHVVHSELAFGYDRPVTLPLPGGDRLPVAGYVDRIDVQRDGELVVMDHKTGRANEFAGITADDPTEGGTKFQLPIYAAAALATRGERAGASDLAVRAEYDFFERGGYARHGYRFDRSVWERVTDDLGEVVAGIDAGLYPAVTEPPKWEFRIACDYCQPDGLGVQERWDEWSRKRADPRLARWFPTADGDDPTGSADDPSGDAP